jgi:hypothetical protein
VPSGTVAAAVGSTGIPIGGTDGTNFRHLKTNTAGELTVNTGLTTVGSLGEKAQTGSLSVTLATDDDLLNCVDKSNNELNVSIENGGFDGVLTAGTADIGKVEVTAMPTTGVTGTFWQATQNTSQVQSAVYTKQYTVLTSRAQVWGSSSQATASGLTVLADSANTGIVYVGGSTVTAGTAQATDGIPLAAGAAFTFSIDNANKVYAITASGVTGQKLNLVAM